MSFSVYTKGSREQIKEAGGTPLYVGSIVDGEFLKRVGGTIVSAAAGGGGISDGDKGDITVSGGGVTWTIDSQAVTFAKIQNVATDRLIGRDTAGSGSPEEISLNTTLEFTGAGAVQRAALTGAVTAAAGSNTTALGSFTTAQLNTALSDNDVATGGGTATGSNTGDQTITLTGNVTGSGTGSFAATIANDAVTYAKMQNVSAISRLLGRGSAAGVGDVEEITLGTNLSMSGTTLNASGGGGGGGNSVTTTLAFGSSFTDKAQTVVTGQAWVALDSEIVVHVKTPSGVDPDEMRLLDFKPVVSDLVAGTGFTVTLYSEPEAKGDYDVMCVGV